MSKEKAIALMLQQYKIIKNIESLLKPTINNVNKNKLKKYSFVK